MVLHEGPNLADDSQDEATSARNARIGIVLFLLYLLLYGGFVLVNTFVPGWMELKLLGGVNLAILYGFVLIIAAFVLAILYGWLCRQRNVKSP